MDLETLIITDNWPDELAGLAREVAAMPPGKARSLRIPALDAAAVRAQLSDAAFSRFMRWQVEALEVRVFATNDPQGMSYGAVVLPQPPALGSSADVYVVTGTPPEDPHQALEWVRQQVARTASEGDQ